MRRDHLEVAYLARKIELAEQFAQPDRAAELRRALADTLTRARLSLADLAAATRAAADAGVSLASALKQHVDRDA